MPTTKPLSRASQAKLRGVYPALAAVTHRAAETSTVPFDVTEGKRSPATQRELARFAAAPDVNPAPMVGKSLRIVPVFDGHPRTDWPLYRQVAVAFKNAARELEVRLSWGGDRREFPDPAYFEVIP